MSIPAFEKVLVGGQWVAAAKGTYEITNPATEEPAGFAAFCSVEQVAQAAAAAAMAEAMMAEAMHV